MTARIQKKNKEYTKAGRTTQTPIKAKARAGPPKKSIIEERTFS